METAPTGVSRPSPTGDSERGMGGTLGERAGAGPGPPSRWEWLTWEHRHGSGRGLFHRHGLWWKREGKNVGKGGKKGGRGEEGGRERREEQGRKEGKGEGGIKRNLKKKKKKRGEKIETVKICLLPTQ